MAEKMAGTQEVASAFPFNLIKRADAADQFVAAIAKHPHFARETDPPRV